jgi:hypothetical protein
MPVMKTIVPYLLIAFIFSAFSCSDKNDGNDCPGITQAAIAGNYRLTALTYRQSSGGQDQNYLFVEPCHSNDIYMFNANGSFSIQDVAPTCTSTISGGWSITGSTLVIEFENFPISSFNCTTLVFYETNFITAGDRLTYTLTRQ